jgi:hypothetical protein
VGEKEQGFWRRGGGGLKEGLLGCCALGCLFPLAYVPVAVGAAAPQFMELLVAKLQ